MSLISTASSRFATTALHLTRLAIHRLGLGTVLLAVTAVAALFASWRAARRPPPPRRRRRQRQISITSRPSDATPNISSEPSDLATNKPRWLSRVRRVTLGAKWTRGVRCDTFCDGEDGAVVVRDEVVAALRKFAKMFDLYLVVEVDDDQAELHVRDAVRAAGLFEEGLLDERKLLFCETDMGRVSVARQIESQLHVDESIAVVSDLQRFLPYVALVSVNAKAVSLTAGSNVTKFTALDAFFS